MRASERWTAWSSPSTVGRLSEHYDVHQFTPYGFEWTYEGEAPQQLALAVLADHLGDGHKALALSEGFMSSVIANLDNDWQLTSKEIDEALSTLKAA